MALGSGVAYRDDRRTPPVHSEHQLVRIIKETAVRDEELTDELGRRPQEHQGVKRRVTIGADAAQLLPPFLLGSRAFKEASGLGIASVTGRDANPVKSIASIAASPAYGAEVTRTHRTHPSGGAFELAVLHCTYFLEAHVLFLMCLLQLPIVEKLAPHFGHMQLLYCVSGHAADIATFQAPAICLELCECSVASQISARQ